MTRTTFATAIFLLACFNSTYAADVSDKLAECAAIQSDAERVACYDAIATGQVKEEAPAAAPEAVPEVVPETVPEVAPAAAPAVVPAAVAVEATTDAATPPAEDTFGQPADDLNREAGVPAGSEKVDQIVATITDLRLYKVYRFLISLDNGQQWRQTSASTKTFDVGDVFEIRKGSFGSYRMTELDGKRAMKVRRVD